MSQGNDKFEWYARDSAPKHFPMIVVRGTFLYRGEAEKGLYVPSGGTIMQGWGTAGTTHAVGEDLKPLPDRLKIIFFSEVERQSYEGVFDLPYDRILELFRQGVAADKNSPLYSDIMVGIAPGGSVAVWVTGRGDTKEVFFGQADKIDLSLSAVFSVPFSSREQAEAFAQRSLEYSVTPEQLDALKTNGIPVDLWARYRNQYDWRPVLAGGYNAKDFDVIFLNGENVRTWVLDGNSNTVWPAPEQLSFLSIMDGKNFWYTVEFDDLEILSVFERLGANGQKLCLELEPRLPQSQLRIRVRNDEEVVDLKKFISS